MTLNSYATAGFLLGGVCSLESQVHVTKEILANPWARGMGAPRKHRAFLQKARLKAVVTIKCQDPSYVGSPGKWKGDGWAVRADGPCKLETRTDSHWTLDVSFLLKLIPGSSRSGDKTL